MSVETKWKTIRNKTEVVGKKILKPMPRILAVGYFGLRVLAPHEFAGQIDEQINTWAKRPDLFGRVAAITQESSRSVDDFTRPYGEIVSNFYQSVLIKLGAKDHKTQLADGD